MILPRSAQCGAPAARATPIDVPTRTDLWYRVQLAKAVLGHRQLTPATAALLLRVLNGDRIEDLVEGQG